MEIPKYRAWVTGAEIMYQPHEAWINNGEVWLSNAKGWPEKKVAADKVCLLYTSPSPRDATLSRMPSSA